MRQRVLGSALLIAALAAVTVPAVQAQQAGVPSNAAGWPAGSEGAPPFEAGKALGYFIWRDAGMMRVRWTTKGRSHQFSGEVTTNGSITEFRRVRLDPNDRARFGRPQAVKRSGNTISWTGGNTGYTDGFDFALSRNATWVRFSLMLDGRLASPNQIFIGMHGRHPAGNPFTLRADRGTSAGRPGLANPRTGTGSGTSGGTGTPGSSAGRPGSGAGVPTPSAASGIPGTAIGWPGNSEQAPPFEAGSALGYFIWRQGGQIQVRWTTKGRTHQFNGHVTTDGQITAFRRVRLDPRDRARPGQPEAITKYGNSISWQGGNTGFTDGFSFSVTDAATWVQFTLMIDGQAASTGQIYIGRDGRHPNGNPFRLQV